jgi:DNA-directed RNA polymerase subunit H (RpoH/RPB5)
MSESEINELLEKMGITANNLPKILLTDPQAKKISAKVGDVIEIEREDLGIQYKYYRQVVPS